MGSLVIETPYSEITATLEVLDRFGVTRDDLRKFRATSPEAQRHMANIFRDADAITSISTTAHRSEPTIERNEHGHIVLTITGLDHPGAQVIKKLEAAQFRVSGWAKSCLLSTRPDSYDANHRLESCQEYKIALMPTNEIKRNEERTTDNLRQRGLKEYGYLKPLAGIAPRIRETVSDKMMEEMGFWYIAAPHEPILDSGGAPSVLYAPRSGDGRWLRAYIAHPGSRWGGSGAFAFLVPAS